MNYFFKRLRFWKLMALLAGVAVVTQSCDSDEKDPSYTPEPPKPPIQVRDTVVNFHFMDVMSHTGSFPENTRDQFRDNVQQLLDKESIRNVYMKQSPEFDFTGLNTLGRSTSMVNNLQLFRDLDTLRVHGKNAVTIYEVNEARYNQLLRMGFDEVNQINR